MDFIGVRKKSLQPLVSEISSDMTNHVGIVNSNKY